MESWPRSREVEKIVPFAERAQTCIGRLHSIMDAFIALDIAKPNGHWSEPMVTLQKAADLLNEAKTRGVKGKDIGR